MSLAQFNPGWLNFGAILVSGLISGSVSLALNSRDAEENRAFRTQQEKWNLAMERRLSDEQLSTGKTLVALQKDVESANKALASIQQALMVRPSPSQSLSSQSTP